MARRKESIKCHPYRIWQDQNGDWYTYLNVNGKKHSYRRKTRDGIEDLIASAAQEEDNSPTIRDVFEECNSWRLETKKISNPTYYRNQKLFDRHYDQFGSRKIKDVSPDEFVNFLEAQIPRFNLTAKAFANLKSITRIFLKRAKRRGLIDWYADYMLSDLDVTDKDYHKVIKEDDEEVFDEAETEQIVRYMIQHMDYKNIGLLLIFATGLRVGELAALKPQDVGEDYINVRRTETRLRENDEFIYTVKDFPKSEAGWRTVVVPEEWTWLLKKIKLMNPWGEWVFMQDGKRVPEKTFQNRLYRLCKKLGIKNKSAHKIRKTYGTILMDGNVDNNLILQQMGHTDIATSERHYHRNRKTIDEKKEKLSGLLYSVGR